MVQIVPAILATSEEEYRRKIHAIEKSGLFKNSWVQIDLMDNKFVQNKSIEPETIAKYPTDSKLEAHLMVEYPENWTDELIETDVERIIFPVEDTEGIKERILHIKNHGKKVGLSINPETDSKKIEDYLDLLDVVLIMSVHPGFGGQDFIPESVGKIKEISRLRSNQRNFQIGVDGGISSENARLLVEAGVDYLVVGSALFKYDNLADEFRKIKEAING